MKQTYKEVMIKSNEKLETNDCTVKALAIAANIDYDVAHDIYKRAGRKEKNGVYEDTVLKAFQIAEEELNVEFTRFEPTKKHWKMNRYTGIAEKVTGKYTMKTIGKGFPEGRFIVKVRGHHAALIDGKIEDWSDDTRRRVIYMWLVSEK